MVGQVTFDIEQNAVDFIRTLTTPKLKYKKPIVVIVVGLPASGKSYLCQNIASALPFVLISENTIQSFLVPRITFFEKGIGQMLDFSKEVVKKLIKMGFNSILDMSLKTFAQREMFRLIVQEAGGEVVTIHLTCPKEACFEKIKNRNLEIQRGELKGFIMDWEYFLFEVNSIEEPMQSENPIAYDSSTNSMQMAKIIKHLKDRLIVQGIEARE